MINFDGTEWMRWYNKEYKETIFTSSFWASLNNRVDFFPFDLPTKTRSYRISHKKLKKYTKQLSRILLADEAFWEKFREDHVIADYDSAVQKITDETFAQACYLTGVWCEGGGLITEYEKEATRFFLTGAKLGNVPCMVELGHCYLNGIAVPRSAKEAVKWFANAAELGDSRAAFELGKCRELGVGGIRKDFSKAWYWYKRAAEEGYVDAQYLVGCILESSHDTIYSREVGLDAFGIDAFRMKVPTAEMLLRKEFRQNYAEAFKWYQKAADQGHPEAAYRLGLCYLNGIGTEQNDFKAFENFARSSQFGAKDGSYMAGICIEASRGCHYGRFMTRRRLAEKMYRVAQQQGHLLADERLKALRLSGRRLQFYSGPYYDCTARKYNYLGK